jgi:hypothetical protein
MAVYQLRTYADLVAAVREELQIASNDTVAVNRIKRDLNIVYAQVLSEDRWRWLIGHTSLQLDAYISNGTASVTTGSNVVTLSTGPSASRTGQYFALDGYSEIYRIESHTAGSTTVRLDGEWTGTTQSGATYKIWSDKVALPTECKETISVWHDHHGNPLQNVGLQEFRRITQLSARSEGKPQYYFTGNFVDPAPTDAITSLPAVSTRASAGMLKTIVFASSVPTSVVTAVENGEPVRWRISSAGQSSYNGDVLITSVSTTTTANDTIVYTGKVPATESATADTTMTIRSLGQEVDYQRYRELFVHPAINLSRVTLHVDFVKEALPLSGDDDEPSIPVEDRVILLYGALHRAWSRQRNPEEATRNFQLYQEKLMKMQGKLQDTFDKPKLLPSRMYLNAKRSTNRGRFSGRGDSPFPASGGSAGAIVTGTASTVAVFNTSGQIEGSSTITTTELGYLNGVTSNIQTQIDDITTLSDGKIYLGNGSNVATEVTLTGDVTVSNAGVTAIAAGVILNADVNAAAAIAHSKMAALTASRVVVTDGSGVASASGVTSTTLGYLDATSSIQTQLDAKASVTSLNDHLADAADAHDASAISSVPSGNLAANTVQAALDELQTDIDTRATTAALTAHDSDTTNVHGIADTSALATKAGAETLTNKVINGSNNTITNVSLTTGVTGTLPAGNGGTGLAAVGAANQVLGTNNAGNAFEHKTVTAGSGISVVHGANSITISASGTPAPNIAVKSGATTAVNTDDYLLCTGTWTLTFTAVAGYTKPVHVKNYGTGLITADADAAETIDGSATFEIAAGESYTFVPDTAAGVWRVF